MFRVSWLFLVFMCPYLHPSLIFAPAPLFSLICLHMDWTALHLSVARMSWMQIAAGFFPVYSYSAALFMQGTVLLQQSAVDCFVAAAVCPAVCTWFCGLQFTGLLHQQTALGGSNWLLQQSVVDFLYKQLTLTYLLSSTTSSNKKTINQQSAGFYSRVFLLYNWMWLYVQRRTLHYINSVSFM